MNVALDCDIRTKQYCVNLNVSASYNLVTKPDFFATLFLTCWRVAANPWNEGKNQECCLHYDWVTKVSAGVTNTHGLLQKRSTVSSDATPADTHPLFTLLYFQKIDTNISTMCRTLGI